MDASPGGCFFVYFRLDSGPPGLLPENRMTKVASCNLSLAHVWRSTLRTSVRCLPVAAQYPSRTARSSSCSHSQRISRISRRLSVLLFGGSTDTGPINIGPQVFAANITKALSLDVDSDRLAKLLTNANGLSQVTKTCLAPKAEASLLVGRKAIEV